MKVQALHQGFIMPTKGTPHSGAFDIYMPEPGYIDGETRLIGLGFSAEVLENHVAMLLPRSSAGFKYGIELANTCGVIDSDYRGEWKAAMRTKDGRPFSWGPGERLLQFLIVPVAIVNLELVESVGDTYRGAGGFGSSGK